MFKGRNTETGERSTHTATMNEIVEHELGIDSHAADAVRIGPKQFRRSPDKNRAVRGGDSYRARSGIPFERKVHNRPHSSSNLVR